MEEMINKHKKSQIIEQKLKVELRSYIDSQPKEKPSQEEKINQIDDYKWINTIDDYKKQPNKKIILAFLVNIH